MSIEAILMIISAVVGVIFGYARLCHKMDEVAKKLDDDMEQNRKEHNHLFSKVNESHSRISEIEGYLKGLFDKRRNKK